MPTSVTYAILARRKRSAGLGLVAVHLDPERRLPVLIPKAA
jgi:hypothetical protein